MAQPVQPAHKVPQDCKGLLDPKVLKVNKGHKVFKA